ncbi:MAG: DUF2868 domain-containing protein, partial [Planctomycetota bacterium]
MSERAVELQNRLLAEAVRAFEQDGSNPLRDRTAEAAARRAGGDFEQRIVARAGALGAARQFDDAMRRVRQVTGLIVTLGAVFALVAGAATARATLGAERAGSVNIYWVIGGVLGVQTLLLLGWLVLNAGSARLPGAAATGVVGAGAGWLGAATMGLARWLARKVHRDPHHLAAIESVGGVWARGSIGRWTLGSISHGLWLAFNVGCLVLAVLLLSTKDYTFTWETTILSSDTYARLTRWIGWAPGALGFETPTPEQIEASRAPASRDQAAMASGAWSGLLLGSIVVYGLSPRLLLFSFCLWRRRRAFQRFRLDLARPGYVRLRPMLMSERDSSEVDGPDLDLDEPEAEKAAKEAHPARPARPAGPPAVLGYEIEPPDSPWPPPVDGVNWLDLGFVDGRDDRRRVREHLDSAGTEPSTVVVFCGLTTSPDRGVRAFIDELQGAVSRPVSLALTGGESLRQRGDAGFVARRVEDWRRLAGTAGLHEDRVIELDLDHLTDASLAKLADLVGVEEGAAPPQRHLEEAGDLIVDCVERWSAERAAPPTAEQAELHRAIARLYRDQPPTWRQLLAAPAELGTDFREHLQSGADRVVSLLPKRMRTNPRWLLAGATAGALGCVAAATLIAPAAITALPLWAALGSALAAVIGLPESMPGEVAADHATEVTDAVRAAALFAVLLELQGQDEATITKVLARVADDGKQEIATPEAARKWLTTLVQR